MKRHNAIAITTLYGIRFIHASNVIENVSNIAEMVTQVAILVCGLLSKS